MAPYRVTVSFLTECFTVPYNGDHRDWTPIALSVSAGSYIPVGMSCITCTGTLLFPSFQPHPWVVLSVTPPSRPGVLPARLPYSTCFASANPLAVNAQADVAWITRCTH